MVDSPVREAPASPDVELLAIKDYKSALKPVWCPGCGDYGVLSAAYKALTSLQIAPHQVVVVSGIGCSSRLPYFMSTYGFHGVHGRALPIATGVKLARPDLTVFAMGGDGDLFSIGAGHSPHAAARNVDITCIMMDNQTYGLTKAQASPTSLIGHMSKSTPYGVVARPQNPVLSMLAFGASFVARGYSPRANELAELIVRAVQHKGFSFLHVQSPCTEFHNTYDYYDGLVEGLPESYDPHDYRAAIDVALSTDKVYLGVIYQEERPTYDTATHGFEAKKVEFDLKSYLERFG